MSNSNGYTPNSLFALEHSLLSNNLVYPVHQFSSEELEESEEDQRRGIEAQAFDWDDAIALEYEEDTDADSESMSQQDAEELEDEEETARSMSWQNYGYASRGFELEEDYDAEAFEVEEEETEDPLSQSNSLFALEQSVFGVSQSYQPSQQFSLEEEEEPPSQSIESQAFDWDDAIALEYPETLYPTPMSLDWQPSDYPSQSFSLENEPATYNVEAFEEEEESEAAPTHEDYPGSAAYGFDADDDRSEPKQDESDNSQAYGFDTDYVESAKPTHQDRHDSATIPVNATVVTPPSPPRQSAQPVEALSDDDFDEFERGTVSDRSSDSEAFAADLAAILRGEKVYEPPVETPAQPAPAPQPQTQPAPQSQAQSVPPKKSSPHDIFDQMGRNMAHATAFDLGTFSLEQRFDEFDALLDAQESESLSQLEDVQSSAPEDTFETAGSFAFDDDELEADVAALSAGDPWQATQFGLDDDAIDNLVKSNQPSKKDIQEKFSNYFKRLKLSAKKLPGYDAKTDDVKIQAAIKKIWKSADSAPAKSGKIAIETPKITGEDLKKRYWHHISIGGTQSNPKDLSGYHWSGYEDNQAMFKRIGKPTKEDVFGIYKQYVQQKGTTNIKKDASSFFPDTWTEKHFDDLFNHFAQRRDFKSNKGGTYEILAAIGGDDKYKSMRVTFMPNAQGGSCVPVYVHEKDRDVQTQLMLNIDPDPEVAQMQSQAQMLGQEFSSSPYEEIYAALDVDETDLPYRDVYTALGTDGVETDIDSLNQLEIATAMGVLFVVSSDNQQAIINALKSSNLSASLINPELEREKQPKLTDPIQFRQASEQNTWNIEDKTKQTYHIRLTDNGLEIHDKSPEQEYAINYLSSVYRDFLDLRREVASNTQFTQDKFKKVREMTFSLEEILKRKNPAPVEELLGISINAAKLQQDVKQYRPPLSDEERQKRFLDDFKKHLQPAVAKEIWQRGKKFGGTVPIVVPQKYWQAIYNQYHGQEIQPQKTTWGGKLGEVVKYYVTQKSRSINGFDISGHVWNGQGDTSETVFVIHIYWER